jgi:N-acetylglucosamine malate deacetylase 1
VKYNKKNILIIAAHPDDEVLGCGGSIAKWVNKGHNIFSLIMAEGATSRDNERDQNSRRKDLKHLKKYAEQAGKLLGVKSVTLLDFPDNRMDSIDLLDVIKPIEKIIEKIKPSTILTHSSFDLNIDHQIIHKAVVTACRPIVNNSVKRILAFEVPSSTEWQSPLDGNFFFPNWFENISDTLDLKIKALQIYKSEMRDWPHPRSIKAVEHLAHWRGATVGYDAAESFMLVREIK